ncbi:MAG: nucleoside-diphosphate sugar epimerase/dehydratase [Patescibacteria group bacterium]|nr:nucleoside-diphosphate sugar epimerase/dehydratase [Patescibacteria group bacterium]
MAPDQLRRDVKLYNPDARTDQSARRGVAKAPWSVRPLPWLRRTPREMVVLGLLAPTFFAVYYLSFWLRFDEGLLSRQVTQTLLPTAAWVILLKIAVFAAVRVPLAVRRKVSFEELIPLVQATTIATLLIVAINRVFHTAPLIPRSVYFLDWGVTLVALGGLQAAIRAWRELNLDGILHSRSAPTLIVGTGDSAEALLRAIRRNDNLTYRVLGFLTRNTGELGSRIACVPVLGMIDDAVRLARRHGVGEILVIKDELSGKQIRRLRDVAVERGIEVKVLPGYEELITGMVAVQPRRVSIEDLLKREPVELDFDSLHSWIDGRVILVTGSAGSIGSEICRQLLHFRPQRLVGVDRSENGQFFLERELSKLTDPGRLDVRIADVLDKDRMRQIIDECRPDIIVHAAAYKHVPLMERHPGEAVRNIITATRQMADLAVECGVESFLLISTDKAVNPTSVMGACKRAAEMYVQSLAATSPCRMVTVRFGNVLDSAGSVVQVFRQQIAAGGPVTVTHPEMRRFFMTIPEAAQLVIQAGAIDPGGHILLLDMGDPVRIADMAADMIRLSGLRVGDDIAIEYSGIRPGEKLFEELRAPGEDCLPTIHPKIIVADHRLADNAAMCAAISELEFLAATAPERVITGLRMIIPEYQTKTSAKPADLIAA